MRDDENSTLFLAWMLMEQVVSSPLHQVRIALWTCSS